MDRHMCNPVWICFHDDFDEEGHPIYAWDASEAAEKAAELINDEYDYVGDTIDVEVLVDGERVPYRVSVEAEIAYYGHLIEDLEEE